jgi:heat shock protein HslJ
MPRFVFIWTLVMLSSAAMALPQAETPEGLKDSSWILLRMDGVRPIPETEISLFISHDSISGNGGCNQYSGGLEIKGDQIVISELISTTMACPGPEGLFEQEAKYWALMNTVRNYRLEEDQLILVTTGMEELVFVRN